MAQFCKSMYAELQMAIFAGTERLTFLDIQRHRGTVFELVALAEKYIISNIHWRVRFDGSLQRKEIPDIPADTIREALINSFCHKDYGACQSNEVAIYKDRVEIYNPGSFPEGYKPEDFISGDERPVRRNTLITSILYCSKDVESFGTGLKRIADARNEANCRFTFMIIKSGFVVVFYRSESHDAQDNVQVGAQDAAQVGIRDKILSCNSSIVFEISDTLSAHRTYPPEMPDLERRMLSFSMTGHSSVLSCIFCGSSIDSLRAAQIRPSRSVIYRGRSEIENNST